MKNKLNLALTAFDKKRFELEDMMQNIDVVRDSVILGVSMQRLKFVKLLESGFTEAQALELCK